MAAPDQFARRIDSVAVSVERNAGRAVRKAALVIDQKVVLATPVDTGRARSNWVVAVDRTPEGEVSAYSPGKNLGMGESGNASAALEQGRRAIASYQPGKNREIHITNNLPYIGRLNDGSSQQAPAGFVERAVQAGAQAARSQKIVGR